MRRARKGAPQASKDVACHAENDVLAPTLFAADHASCLGGLVPRSRPMG